MISAISRIITNPTLVSVAQNTNASVASETVLKSVGRPGFILIDNDIDPATKKYAAAKEFLYQATCLAIYMTLVGPVFKAGAFKIAKKYIYKGSEGFNKFQSMKEYLAYHKLADKSLTNRTASLSKDHSQFKFEHDNLRKDLLNNRARKYNRLCFRIGNLSSTSKPRFYPSGTEIFGNGAKTIYSTKTTRTKVR